MKRMIGTSVFGLRAPIVKAHDNLQEIVIDVLKDAVNNENIQLSENDVVCVTESMVARCQNNYVHIDDITKDLNSKFKNKIGVIFPITSRNRFSIIMKAIANTKKDIMLFLSYPSDEVGNPLFDKEILLDNDIDYGTTTLDENTYRKLIKNNGTHLFTGINYVDLYKSYAVNDNITVYLTNNVKDIAKMCDEILIANIHDREYYKKVFKKLGVKTIYSLADIMNTPNNETGYNEQYGLYGSNLSSDTTLKLFPHHAQEFADELQNKIYENFNIRLNVLVYGDGAFKDPKGKIWELADPVVSPGYTSKLNGTPNELKIKYVADNIKTDNLEESIINEIKKKEKDLTAKNISLGTTPRQYTDLLGSLADLTSGSGDKGTPIVLIKGYFDNYSDK